MSTVGTQVSDPHEQCIRKVSFNFTSREDKETNVFTDQDFSESKWPPISPRASTHQRRTHQCMRRISATYMEERETQEQNNETLSVVIYLSNVDLNKKHFSVLSSAPTNNTCVFNTKLDLFIFYHILHLKTQYFQNARRTTFLTFLMWIPLTIQLIHLSI